MSEGGCDEAVICEAAGRVLRKLTVASLRTELTLRVPHCHRVSGVVASITR